MPPDRVPRRSEGLAAVGIRAFGEGAKRFVASSDRPSFLVPRIGEVLADKYVIEAELGRGGMGIVFAATNQLTDRRVAIKWMLPRISGDGTRGARFRREAKLAGAIDHPNVVAIYDVCFEGEAAFIVMELLQGEPLSALLGRRQTLTWVEALAVLVPAMRGVDAAHARQVVHRDLKPDNIFLCKQAGDGPAPVKVLDFGVSKGLSQPSGQPALTETGALVGTTYYMSPEQAREAKDLDHRVDVYAFGVILYEVLTGERPFVAEGLGQLLAKIEKGEARPLCELQPALPHQVEQVVATAMARDREQRYPSIAALLEALKAADGAVYELGNAQTRSEQPLFQRDVPRSRPRAAKRWTIAAAVALALCSAAALAFFFRPPQERVAAQPTAREQGVSAAKSQTEALPSPPQAKAEADGTQVAKPVEGALSSPPAAPQPAAPAGTPSATTQPAATQAAVPRKPQTSSAQRPSNRGDVRPRIAMPAPGTELRDTHDPLTWDPIPSQKVSP